MNGKWATGLGTKAVWAGEQGKNWHGSTQVPVVRSVSFAYKDLDEWRRVTLGQAPGYLYSRSTNPTVTAFENKLRALEGGEAATSFASGMAAISNTLFSILKPGDRVVSVKDTYGGTSAIFLHHLPRWGVDVELCDTDDIAAIETAIANGCQLVYLETPTNPTLKVTDLERISRAAHCAGALVVVDNTFATPLNQQPLALGADLVIHSASKYLGGHADALGGIVCGKSDLVDCIYRFREIQGAAIDPMAAYLILRGMKTLHLRIKQQNASALAIARRLNEHTSVKDVFYPGLETHPSHEIARRQMRGFGGMLSFSLVGGLAAVERFLPRLKLAHLAPNLGAVETIAGTPALTSHAEISAEDRAAIGIPEGLIRYSVGIEETSDLLADIEQALSFASETATP